MTDEDDKPEPLASDEAGVVHLEKDYGDDVPLRPVYILIHRSIIIIIIFSS